VNSECKKRNKELLTNSDFKRLWWLDGSAPRCDSFMTIYYHLTSGLYVLSQVLRYVKLIMCKFFFCLFGFFCLTCKHKRLLFCDVHRPITNIIWQGDQEWIQDVLSFYVYI